MPVPGTWRDTLRRSSDGPAGGAAGQSATRTGGHYRNGRGPVRTSARARHPVLGVLGVLGVLNPPVRTRTRAPPPWDWSLDAAVAVRRAHRRTHWFPTPPPHPPLAPSCYAHQGRQKFKKMVPRYAEWFPAIFSGTTFFLVGPPPVRNGDLVGFGPDLGRGQVRPHFRHFASRA